MTTEHIKKKVLQYGWKPWLKRPFYAFIMSTYDEGNTAKALKKIGLPGWDYDFFLNDGEWYQTDKNFQKIKPAVTKWLQKHSIQEITSRLEKSYVIWKEVITQLSQNPEKDTLKKLKSLDDILRCITSYIWATHAAEYFFTPILKAKVRKIIKSNVDKFIGDASFPSKLNEAEQMVEAYKNGVSPKVLAKKYGWLRARDGFARPYNTKEIAKIAEHALVQSKHIHPIVPKSLEKIFAEARELVYYRTLRGDCYFELMYIAKPILKALGKKFNIPYSRLKYYTTESLIKEKPKYYSPHFTATTIKGRCYYFDKPIFAENLPIDVFELKGNIAQNGKAKGTIKIVMSVKDLEKVQKGDILVTYMTNPNFLPAMIKAKAFVTDEGGLTCHAAIVAREMNKPCIIGTKIATKVFKDGDTVEVDANKGIVRKI